MKVQQCDVSAGDDVGRHAPFIGPRAGCMAQSCGKAYQQLSLYCGWWAITTIALRRDPRRDTAVVRVSHFAVAPPSLVRHPPTTVSAPGPLQGVGDWAGPGRVDSCAIGLLQGMATAMSCFGFGRLRAPKVRPGAGWPRSHRAGDRLRSDLGQQHKFNARHQPVLLLAAGRRPP